MARSITFSGRDILIDGRPSILYGGEFQYFRSPKHLWGPSLRRFKEAGCNLVTCYIPWIWHEPEPGVFDFTGETIPERDIVTFMRLVDEMDMALIVRPGPYVYAEYQGFGIPEWLREQHPELLMVHETGRGKEIAVGHPGFLPFVETWFRQIWAHVEPHAKSGRVIAWQIDNEVGLPQFGTAPSPGEFNPATLSRYRAFLQERWGDVAGINQLMGTRWPSYDSIQAPRLATATVAEMWQWCEFVEDDLVAFLRNLKRVLVGMGVDLPFILNDPCLGQWPNNFAKKADIAPIGFDIYTKISAGAATHDFPFTNSYAPPLFRAANPTGPLMAVELACGWFNPRVKVKPEATMQLAMQVLARGTNLLSYYILQDAIEPDGSHWIWEAALTVTGEPGPRYAAVNHVGQFLQVHAESLASSVEVKSPIAIGHYLPGAWLKNKPGVSFLGLLDIEGSALISHFSGPSSLFGVLNECGYNPDVVLLQGATLDSLQAHKVIFYCSTGYLDDETYTTLSAYVAGGGILITSGHPVRCNLLDRPYEDNPLYPAKPLGALNHTHFGQRKFVSQSTMEVLDYRWQRRALTHKRSLETLDQMHPFVDLVKHIGAMGTWLKTDKGHPFWASRFTSVWHGHGVTPLLRLNGTPVGYSARLGAGKSIFLGTLPGIFFDSPLYYTKDVKKKNSVLDFFSGLLRETGIRPLHNQVPGVEMVFRRGDGYQLLILFNKGAACDVAIELYQRHGEQIETVFSGWGSRQLPGKDGLRLHLAADDVMVLRFTD
ncbi:MAG: beta-galactosidase [Candidatus Sericytochromatia bacterium]|nr:beta-galactosidase [Candidatus Sericytochromatia bacterium]